MGKRVTVKGWLVTTRRAVTRKHEYMKFLTIEDRHGVIECVAFPDTYRKYGARMSSPGCYEITGTVKDQFGATGVVVEDVQPIPAGVTSYQ